ICPPHAAVDLARLVMARSFSGIYVDANAVAPATGREIGKIVTDGGATFVDGGIVGPPPRNRGTTRLYLSGAEAARMARLFEQGALEAIAIEGGPRVASAHKTAHADEIYDRLAAYKDAAEPPSLEEVLKALRGTPRA